MSRPSVLGIVLCVVGWTIADATFLHAQGPFRRLGDRLRSRVAPPGQGAPAPLPNIQSANRPPIPPYNAAGDQDPRGQGLRSVAPMSSDQNDPQQSQPPGRASVGIEVAQWSDLSTESSIAGLRVVSFQPQSLAQEAGLSLGDVIVAIQGVPTRSIAAIAAELNQRRPGDFVVLKVIPGSVLASEGRIGLYTREVRVPLVQRAAAPTPVATPEPQPNAQSRLDARRRPDGQAPDAQASGPRQGVQAGPSGLSIANSAPRQGGLVASIVPDSPASRAQFEPGDRIVSIDGRVTRDADSVLTAVSMLRPGTPLRIQYVRDDQLRETRLSLDEPATSGSNASATEPPAGRGNGSGSLLGGLGSAFGSLFGGETAPPSNQSGAPATKAANEATAPQNPAAADRGVSGLPSQDPDIFYDSLPAPMPEPDASRPVSRATEGYQPINSSQSSRKAGAASNGAANKPGAENADPLALGDDEPLGQVSPAAGGAVSGKRAQTVAPAGGDSSSTSGRLIPIPATSPSGSPDGELPMPAVQTAPYSVLRPSAAPVDRVLPNDPPSLNKVEPPQQSVTPENGGKSANSGSTVEALQAEIDRLRERLRQLQEAKSQTLQNP